MTEDEILISSCYSKHMALKLCAYAFNSALSNYI